MPAVSDRCGRWWSAWARSWLPCWSPRRLWQGRPQASRAESELAAGLLLTGCSGVADAVDLVRGEPTESSATVDAEEHDEGNDARDEGGNDQVAGADPEPESGDGAGDDAEDASGTATPADELELTTCEAERYPVDAPADWHVNDGERIGDCRIFHPEPVEIPEGEHSYLYLVDLDGQTLIASTYTVGDSDYERDKQLLDRMVEGLELSS